MNSDTMNQTSHKFESALSAIIPKITQVIQQYQVSGAFKTELRMPSEEERLAQTGVCVITGSGVKCNTSIRFSPVMLTPELDHERAEQFWTDIASILTPTMTLLEQSVENTDQSFEVHFFIKTAELNSEQPIVCQWDSDTPQINILQCSKP